MTIRRKYWKAGDSGIWESLHEGGEELLDIARPLLRRLAGRAGLEGAFLSLSLILGRADNKNFGKRFIQEMSDAGHATTDVAEEWHSEILHEIKEPATLILEYGRGEDGEWLTEGVGSFLRNVVRPSRSRGFAREWKKRMQALAASLGLSQSESAVLHTAYLTSSSRKLSTFLSESMNSHSQRLLAAFIAAGHGLRKAEVEEAFSIRGNLSRYALLDENFFASSDPLGNFSLSADILNYLNGIVKRTPQEIACEPLEGETLDWDHFQLPARMKDICLNLLRRAGESVNLIFYGGTGLGKTTFTRSLARRAGLRAQLLKCEHAKPQETAGRLRMAAAFMDPSHDLLVVDEADSILNTESFPFAARATLEKGWINQFLESHGKRIVWITNHHQGIEESTLRRFDFSHEFRGFSAKAKEEMWRQALADSPYSEVIVPERIREYSARFPLSPANIRSVLRVLGACADPANPQESLHIAEEVMQRQARLLEGSQGENVLQPTGVYGLEFVNADPDPAGVLAAARRFLDTPRRSGSQLHGIAILLQGPPGTGKTEYAKYLATSLDRRLLLKKASDLLSKWVGQTESLIRDAFEEAREDGALLLIDEADSFLAAREHAQHSWEVTQVNELLVQMERHSGISLFATNFPGHLDKASLRRFAFKLNFRPLRPDQAQALFARCFGAGLADSLPLRQAFPASLTFGDFKVVQQKLCLSQVEHTTPALLEELRREAADRGEGRRVGF